MGLDALHRALVTAALLAAGPAPACEVALALALDVSGSVDPAEYRLQTAGLAAALRDGLVADALIGARAAVSVIEWTGRSRQAVTVPWTRVTGPEVLEALAVAVETGPRTWTMFSTGIGEALVFAASTFGPVGDCRRRVIDVSGDGRSNEGVAPEEVRDDLAAAGFTINGLAIEGSEEGIADYYREKVIAGPGAFVFVARSFADYPEKIRAKLVAEVTEPVTEAPLLRRASAP